MAEATIRPTACQLLPFLFRVIIPMMGVVGAIGTTTATGSPQQQLLSPQRWCEHAYGLSLQPPLGSRLVSQTADDAVVRFYGESGYTIRAYISNTTIDLSMQDLLLKAIHQMAGAYPSATILEQKPMGPSHLGGKGIYFRIPDPKKGYWIAGQVYLKLSPRSFVMLQLEADAQGLNHVKQVFEAVVDSVEVQDPKDLDHLRTRQIDAGEVWCRSVTVKQLQGSIQAQQWLRVVENDSDIGYVHVTQVADTDMGQPGVRIDIQSRILWQGHAYDSISRFFASAGGDHETWSIRTTVRPRQRSSKKLATQSWAETGVRSNDKITVSLESPTGVQEYRWEKPPRGYLSQVQLQLLEQLLLSCPPTSQDMGFYAYHPNTHKISYRTTRVERAADGSCTIRTRPSTEQQEQISHYGPDGKLQKRELGQGRQILPTTKQQLSLKWQIR